MDHNLPDCHVRNGNGNGRKDVEWLWNARKQWIDVYSVEQMNSMAQALNGLLSVFGFQVFNFLVSLAEQGV